MRCQIEIDTVATIQASVNLMGLTPTRFLAFRLQGALQTRREILQVLATLRACPTKRRFVVGVIFGGSAPASRTFTSSQTSTPCNSVSIDRMSLSYHGAVCRRGSDQS